MTVGRPRAYDTGQDWRREIDDNIQRANAAILLISQDFITSKFILDNELRPLLERRLAGSISIFPLLVRYSTWKAQKALAEIQARPRDGEPLDGRGRAKKEKELAAFAEELSEIFAPTSNAPLAEEYRGKGEERAQPAPRRFVDLIRAPHETAIGQLPAVNMAGSRAAFKRFAIESGAASRMQVRRAGAADERLGSGTFGSVRRDIELP